MNCSVVILAVLPVFVVPVAIGITTAIVIFLLGWGLWRAFHEEQNFLLTGFSGAGKTELHIALAAFVKKGRHENHSEEHTLDSFNEVKISAKRFMIFKDGGGSVDHSALRQPTYCKFFREALGAWVDKYVVLFLVDLSTFSDVDHKRHVKSELTFLNRIAKEEFEKANPGDGCRIEAVIVGTHIDKICSPMEKERIVAEFNSSTMQWIDEKYFRPRYLTADLYHNDSAKKFAKELFGVE